MKFSPDREAEFAEIERRADAVKRLRALPNADDVVALDIRGSVVRVTVSSARARVIDPGCCVHCGTPNGDKVEIDVSADVIRLALERIFADRAKELEAIATGTAFVDVDLGPIVPDPFPADIRTLYGGALISARRDADRPPDVWVVTYSTNTGNGLGEVVGTEDWLRKNVPPDAYDVPF